jgi:membrane dipeptidase
MWVGLDHLITSFARKRESSFSGRNCFPPLRESAAAALNRLFSWRGFLARAIYLAVFLVIYGVVGVRAQVSAKAKQLHDAAFVFDGHIHMVNRQLYHGGDIGARVTDGQVDLPRMRMGGVDALLFSLFVSEEYYPARFETQHALRLLDLAKQQVARNQATIEFALNAEDIERINKTGKIAAVLDLEGGFSLDGDLEVLRKLYGLGLRSAQLPAHNWANEFADSCCAKPKWHGLNERGRAVVKEMNRLGMLINVSHASDETMEQTIDLSKDPVVATHHGLRSVNNIPRNISDHLLKKLAAKGGVMGFQIGNEFHNVKLFEWRTQQRGRAFWDTSEIGKQEASMTIEQIDRLAAPKFPMVGTNAPESLKMTPAEWVDVVDRAIQLVGENHVALGSDFDGGPTLPRGMRDIRDLPMITEAMLRRGYSEERIRKFLGGNLLRVFGQVTEKQGK